MAEQDKKEIEIESLEATEVEDEDLENVSGGDTDNNCGCSVKSDSFGSLGGGV